MLKNENPVKSYVAKGNDQTSIIPSTSLIEGSGPAIRLPKRADNKLVMYPDRDAIIPGPLPNVLPSSAFASGLNSCSAFIYIYLNKDHSIDHIVVYHSPSTALPLDHGPLAKEYNTKETDPKNIQIIIGTPNGVGDDGIKRALEKLQYQFQIPAENIQVYYKCHSSFGIDSYGNIGEMGGFFSQYVNNCLQNAFIESMNQSLDLSPKESKTSFWQTSELTLAKKFIKKVSSKKSLEDMDKYLNKYLNKADFSKPIAKSFLENIVKKLNQISGINFQFSHNPTPSELKTFMIALATQVAKEANLNLDALMPGANTQSLSKQEKSNF